MAEEEKTERKAAAQDAAEKRAKRQDDKSVILEGGMIGKPPQGFQPLFPGQKPPKKEPLKVNSEPATADLKETQQD